MKGISSKYWSVYFPELSVFQYTVRVDKWLDNKDYSDDGKTLKVVPFSETDKYRKLVEQNKSIYYQLYFKK